ncbi:hypothetical protein [Alkaliphilus transvaalensis]|uniref:hypothetical protein n=1 Tax=Alkaliphilus transvaalensis TaxID=114628 RepID=UPI0005543D50|nr:hypothetical protein [Alkaliphilus transvaalensis]
MTIDSYEAGNDKTVSNTDTFPCSSCGGGMVFNPEKQALECHYCGSIISIEGTSEDIKEHDFASGEALCSTDWGRVVRVIHCNHCGAETVLESNNTVQHCAFCDSSHISNIDEQPGIRPESLVPFKVTANQAKEQFSKWLKKKFFAPKDLKSHHHIDHLSGVYIPYWTYDAQTNSVYRGEKGTYYYVNETVYVTKNGKRVAQNKRVRKTRWSFTSGVYNEFFDDELVPASKQVDALVEKLATFNLKDLVSYRPEYFSGFIAEKYSIGLKEGWTKAKEAIKSKIRSGVIRKINGDTVRNLHISTSYDQITYKHILLPIWISAYTYKGKTYQFLINGQTGEVQGKAPYDKLKVTITILSIIAVIAVILRVVSQLQ